MRDKTIKKLVLLFFLAFFGCATFGTWIQGNRNCRECFQRLNVTIELNEELIETVVYYMKEDSLNKAIIDTLRLGICPSLLIEKLKQTSLSKEREKTRMNLLIYGSELTPYHQHKAGKFLSK